MDGLVEKARTKIGNAIFMMGKYPDKMLYHAPWLATDEDVLEHLTKNSIRFNAVQAKSLSQDIIQVCSEIIKYNINKILLAYVYFS